MWSLLVGNLHPWNLTWNLKRSPCKRRFLLQTIIFRFHVKFCHLISSSDHLFLIFNARNSLFSTVVNGDQYRYKMSSDNQRILKSQAWFHERQFKKNTDISWSWSSIPKTCAFSIYRLKSSFAWKNTTAPSLFHLVIIRYAVRDAGGIW